MKTRVQQPQLTSRTIQSKVMANNQASIRQILQRYKDKTIQRQDTDDEELLQGKFENTTQLMDMEDEEEPVQQKTIQCVTDEKKIKTKTQGEGWYKYNHDAKGNIDNFSNNIATNTPKGSDPVVPFSVVNLDQTGNGSGEMRSGKEVDILKATRSQHFSIADGDMDMVPSDRKGLYTWHHLTPKYWMHLVDMSVHAAFGHNGGFSLWR